MPITPYLRPDLDQAADTKPLFVSGDLPNASPGAFYEGRLQIHNQIGSCTVEQISGDTLPPGHSIYVDGDEVVVTWPAYAEDAAPIPNAGFEAWMDGWAHDAGWTVTETNPVTDTRSAVFWGVRGSSILRSTARYPVAPGATITARCLVRQGASSAGNAGAGVRLEWRDADGAVVGFNDGNMVMSASNNAVFPSTVTASAPSGAETVNIACHGLRRRQNLSVWVDSFTWDYAVPSSGTNADGQYCITLQVRDGAGRTALWSGCVALASDPAPTTQAPWSRTLLSAGGLLEVWAEDQWVVTSLSSGNSSGTILSDNFKVTGKYYAECERNQVDDPYSDRFSFGVYLGTAGINGNFGEQSNAFAICETGTNQATFTLEAMNNNVNRVPQVLSQTSGIPALGRRLCVAVDLDAGKVWFGYDLANAGPRYWAYGGDPEAGTDPTYTFTPGSNVYLAGAPLGGSSWNTGSRTSQKLIHPENWRHAKPVGFASWSIGDDDIPVGPITDPSTDPWGGDDSGGHAGGGSGDSAPYVLSTSIGPQVSVPGGVTSWSEPRTPTNRSVVGAAERSILIAWVASDELLDHPPDGFSLVESVAYTGGGSLAVYVKGDLDDSDLNAALSWSHDTPIRSAKISYALVHQWSDGRPQVVESDTSLVQHTEKVLLPHTMAFPQLEAAANDDLVLVAFTGGIADGGGVFPFWTFSGTGNLSWFYDRGTTTNTTAMIARPGAGNTNSSNVQVQYSGLYFSGNPPVTRINTPVRGTGTYAAVAVRIAAP